MFAKLSREQKTILMVLTAVNFFNYVDRQVIFPLFDVIKKEFLISDFQLGLLGTVFMLVHSLASVPLGVLADRYSRKKIIAGGVLFWSAASFASGLALSFKSLLAVRSLVGVGEAAYAPAATALITDNVPQEMRAQAQGVFNAGMFVGGTVGAMIGGVIAFYAHSNWRVAFFIVSIPGVVLAYLASKLKERLKTESHEAVDVWQLFYNTPYVWVVISGIFTTFAVGAFISWGIEFVVRYLGYNLRDASLILGMTLMIAGVTGVFLGSFIADTLQKTYAWGRSVTVAVSLILAGPIMFLGLHSTGNNLWFLVFFFMGTMLLSFYHGPSTAVMHDVISPKLYATGFALYLLVIHLLGDALAPAVVGKISDSIGLQAALEWCTALVFVSGVAFLFVAWLVNNKSLKRA